MAVLSSARRKKTRQRLLLIGARIEGRAISSTHLQPSPSKLTGNPACLTHIPYGRPIGHLPRESKNPLSKIRNSSLHKLAGVTLSTYCSFGIVNAFFNKTDADGGSAPPISTSFSQKLSSSHV